ncbi:MAG: hydrogenase maturation nickel metallochaperone HypA [Gammaproteobacteria bacterium]|nr:hydrogenase maturation nickel metallochaperone HypA [Gammaproteobacteria bacterium]
MHELAICQALMNQVESIAAERNAHSVVSIVVGMGPLSGVEAQLLKHAYPVASAGTVAEGAELVIESLPVRIKCTQCGSESDALPNKLVCKACGDWRTTLISGDELMLMRVELETAAEQAGKPGEADEHGATIH